MASFPPTRLVLKNISCIGSPASLKTLELLIGIVLSVVLVLFFGYCGCCQSVVFMIIALRRPGQRRQRLRQPCAPRSAGKPQGSRGCGGGRDKRDAELRRCWLWMQGFVCTSWGRGIVSFRAGERRILSIAIQRFLTGI